jgi:hypothetical protein
MHELVAFRNTKDSISRSIAIVEAIQRGIPYQPPATSSLGVSATASVASVSIPHENADGGTEITYKSF